MTVYVDAMVGNGWVIRGRRVRNCHLFTDGDLEELHAFANRIGMKPEWFQDKHVQHYDLTSPRRVLAVACGAVEVDRRQAVRIWRESKEKRCVSLKK